ncbi:CDC27 family protein [Saccharicrinis sp. 156]|uniref:tetratricopeptide repeat protein n=1 Tax=Saccharicrinis sp. 156 TaxID=3417574 RepID=UPI003D349589
MIYVKSKLMLISAILFAVFTLVSGKPHINHYTNVKDSLNVENDSLQLIRVNALSKNFRYDDAIAVLEKLFDRDSLNVPAATGLENLYFKQSQYNRAIYMQDYLQRLKVDTTYYTIRKAMCLKKMGQYQKSLDIFRSAFDNDTLNSFLTHQMGDLYKSLHKPDSAIVFYNKTCEIKPSSAVMIKAMDLYLKTKKEEEALQFFNKYFKIEFAVNHLLHRLYGKALYLNDKVGAARLTFNTLYSSGDSSLVTTKYLGMCEWKLENYAASIAPFEHYLKKDSTDFQVYFMLGSSLVNDEFIFNPEKSISCLKRSLALIQADGNTLNLIYNDLALNYQRTQQHEKELEVYLLMKENVPDSRYVDYKLATLYDYGFKNKKEALHRYTDLLTLYQADSLSEKSDVQKFCENRILELKEEEFWEDSK